MSCVRSLNNQGRIRICPQTYKIANRRVVQLAGINKLQSLRNGYRLLGVFGPGRQGVNVFKLHMTTVKKT